MGDSPGTSGSSRRTDHERHRDEYIRLIGGVQIELLRYLTALLGDFEAANNALQETNVVLWQKMDEFVLGTNFQAWATKIAYWQARAYARDLAREKLVFSEEFVVDLADCHDQMTSTDESLKALQLCLQRLRSEDRDLIAMRYGNDFSIQQMSGRLQKSPAAIKGALQRVRRKLRACIEVRLAHGS